MEGLVAERVGGDNAASALQGAAECQAGGVWIVGRHHGLGYSVN